VTIAECSLLGLGVIATFGWVGKQIGSKSQIANPVIAAVPHNMEIE
jgi:hypothetical protein